MRRLTVGTVLGLLLVMGLAGAARPTAVVAQTRQSSWTEAYAAYSRGDYGTAETLFRDLVGDYPNWGYARYMLAQTLQRLGRSDEALAQLRQGEQRPADPESRLLTQRALAELRLQRGEYEEAIQAAREAERLLATMERREPVQDRYLGEIFGNLDEQRVALTGILGRLFLQRERWQEASGYFERLTELRPGDPAAFALLGRARYRLERPTAALEAFERTLQIDPSHAEALRYSSRIHLEQGRSQQALEVARRGLQRRPGDAELLVILGRAALETGRYREAVEALQAAAAQRPLGGELRCRLGDAYWQLDEPELAAEQYRAGRDLLRPGAEILPGCLQGLATAYEETGRDRDALDAYRELLRIAPTAQVATAVSRLEQALAAEEAGFAGPWDGTPAAASPGETASADEALELGEPGASVTVLQDFSGSGTRSTRPFEAASRWEIQWASTEGIRIVLHTASGEELGVAAEQTAPGRGSTFQPEGGAYFLRVESTGDWRIRLVELGP